MKKTSKSNFNDDQPPKKKQGISWTKNICRSYFHPDHAITKKDLVVGKIFFETNKCELDVLDKIVLNNLSRSINNRIKEGYKLHLVCTGEADHRGKDNYNLLLGIRRANNVLKYLKVKIPGNQITIEPRSVGERNAKKKATWEQMLQDRGVKIELNPVRSLAPVALGFKGKWVGYKSLEMIELNNGGEVVEFMNSEFGKESFKESKEKAFAPKLCNSIWDPFRPTHVVEVSFFDKKSSKKNIASIECTVKEIYPSNKNLFKINASSPQGDFKQLVQYHPDNPKGARWVLKENEIFKGKGFITEEKTLPKQFTVHYESQYLLEEAYRQLQGNHTNITERIKALRNES